MTKLSTQTARSSQAWVESGRGVPRWAPSFVFLAAIVGVGCHRGESGTPAGVSTSAKSIAAPASTSVSPSLASVESPGAPPAAAAASVEPVPEDPAADPIVEGDAGSGPPAAVPDCEKRLEALGVKFGAGSLPLITPRGVPIPQCGANDAVTITALPSGLKVKPPALVTCKMALGLVRLDRLLQREAEKHFGSKVTVAENRGTYNCRKMARFDFVSEHAFGNAIDLGGFTLASGKKLTLAKHFGALDAVELPVEARFLRSVGEAAFDEELVSVSLGPYWDSLHRDHFHFDMARYHVDGSRPH